MNPRELLLNSFKIALEAVDPLKLIPAHLPTPPKGNTLVVGAGKAAAAMAQAVETHWLPDANSFGYAQRPGPKSDIPNPKLLGFFYPKSNLNIFPGNADFSFIRYINRQLLYQEFGFAGFYRNPQSV